ncbi:MAG: hypothetical protein HYR90_00630 [Candidatus Andersenbacteria bacterium]|nr:hypothetical protein [Candidatus Andersenbacteria bacterium]MBI3251245.1 hypothetical protein [Candidatus Andersenbacteria bacterium]
MANMVWPDNVQRRLQKAPQDTWKNKELEAIVDASEILSAAQFQEIIARMQAEGAFAIRLEHKELPQLNTIITFSRAADTRAWPMGTNVWIRDLTLMAERLVTSASLPVFAENKEIGKQMILSALSLMSTPSQLNRFRAIISGRTDVTRASNWPHIFLDSRDNLSGERMEGWSHKQEAWQMTAVVTLQMLQSGILTASDLLPSHKEFLHMCAPFLAAVKYWQNPSSGSWEEIEAVRSSVLAWDIVLLEELKAATLYSGLDIDELLEKGKEVLRRQWPNDAFGDSKDDPRHREADAALMYLLQLHIAEKIFAPGEQAEREQQILDQIAELEDVVTGGIRRYRGDSYQRVDFFRPDVAQKLQEYYGSTSGEASTLDNFVAREDIVPKGREAAWVHPVWQLAAWFGRRYLQSGDNVYKQKQHQYFIQGLSLVTGQGAVTVEPDETGEIQLKEILPWRIPECYITVNIEGKDIIVPSPHTPLNWTIAEAIDAFVVMEQTLKQG